MTTLQPYNSYELLSRELLRTIRAIRYASRMIRPWRAYNRGYRAGANDAAQLIEFNLSEKLKVADALSKAHREDS